MPKKNIRVKSEDKKVEAEYNRKVAAIKAEVRKRQPQLRFEIPPLLPRIGTLDFQHLVHPFKPNNRFPQDLIRSPVKSEAELKKKLEIAKQRKAEAESRRRRQNADSDGSDYDDDDGSLGSSFLSKKKKSNARFEDFVIPNIIDAETGEDCTLTRATWSTDEGRVNEDMETQLKRGTGVLKIKNRPDSSHRIVPILSPRVAKRSKFKATGSKVIMALAFKNKGKKDGSHDDDGDMYTNEGTNSQEGSLDGSQKSGHVRHSEFYELHKKKNEGHKSQKFHLYDETAAISAKDTSYWRHDDSRHHVHHYEHLDRGLTKEEVLEREHHNQLHHLHLNFKDGVLATASGSDSAPKIHVHSHKDTKDEVHKKHVKAAKKMHPLVAHFIKEGPQQPMYHKFWDKRMDRVVLPNNYINDEDNDADGYLSHDEDEVDSPRGVVGVGSGEGHGDAQGSARSTTSSVGFESVETISKDKAHRDKQVPSTSRAGALSAELEKAKKKGHQLVEDPLQRDPPTGDDNKSNAGSAVSILSDALDPDNEVSWKALEDRYYYEIRDAALDYEANKLWTKETPMKGGVGGMDIAIRAYANWKMRSIKFIVQAIDDEEKKEVARLALEDELEINKPERLLDQVKIHNEERHKHRTYIKTFKYDMEIVALRKLNELGLVW